MCPAIADRTTILRIRRHLSYSNLVATLALFVSLGAGAYAAGLGRNDVKSRNIADDTIKSRDVRDHTLLGPDIRDETLDFKEIREDRLDVSQFANVASIRGSCDPQQLTFVDCASVVVTAEQVSDVLVVAGGEQISQNGPSAGRCRIAVDGGPVGEVSPGEFLNDNTEGSATNGFAVTGVSANVDGGQHTVALQCNQTAGNTAFGASVSVLVLDAT